MMDIRRVLLLASCLLVPLWATGGALASPLEAVAAPERTDSDPAPDSHVAEPPGEVSITFSEPVDPSSGMQVLNECGERIDDRNVTVELMTMRVGIEDGPSGHYVVEYLARSVNGLTGDTRGRFHFIVDSGRPCARGHGDHGNHEEPDPPPDHNHDDGGDEGEGTDDHSGGGHSDGSNHSAGHGRDPEGHGKNAGGQHRDGHGGDHRGRNGRHGKHDDGTHNGDMAGTPAPSPSPTSGAVAAPPSVDPPAVEGEALLTALALAGLVGSLGGWILRVERD